MVLASSYLPFHQCHIYLCAEKGKDYIYIYIYRFGVYFINTFFKEIFFSICIVMFIHAMHPTQVDFTHILQGYLSGTGKIIWQHIRPEEYGQMNQDESTRIYHIKHNPQS